MAAGQATLDRALNRQVLAQRALEIQTTRDKNITLQLTALALENNINLSTLYRLVETYQKGGLDALMYRRGPQPLKSIEPAVIEYARELLLSDPAAKGSAIINNIELVARNKVWKIGSRASLYRLLIRLRKELNLELCNHKPSCNRDKIHHYVEQLPPEHLGKVEAYLEYLLSPAAGGQPVKSKQNPPASISQATLEI